jgi:hypothetical protein
MSEPEAPVTASIEEEPVRIAPPLAPPQRLQYTLAELLLLSTAASIFLSLASCVLHFVAPPSRPHAFAGLTGLTSLLLLIALALSPTEQRLMRVGWWIMLSLYIGACLFLLAHG